MMKIPRERTSFLTQSQYQKSERFTERVYGILGVRRDRLKGVLLELSIQGCEE